MTKIQLNTCYFKNLSFTDPLLQIGNNLYTQLHVLFSKIKQVNERLHVYCESKLLYFIYIFTYLSQNPFDMIESRL